MLFLTAGLHQVVINRLQSYNGYIGLILEEVQLFKNGVQIPANSLTFFLSSSYGGRQVGASYCNDGIISNKNYCETKLDDLDPTLTIVSATAFDTVVVYNADCCPNQIEGATITATVNGISQTTVFPSSPDAVFTFGWSSSALVLYTGNRSTDLLIFKICKVTYFLNAFVLLSSWPL